MRKKFYVLFLFLVVLLAGCNLDKGRGEEKIKSIFKTFEYTDQQEQIFKTAYYDSIVEYLEEGDHSKIEIKNYFGKIGELDFVSFYSLIPINPHHIYHETIEKMDFRYDHAGERVFGIHEGRLYTTKQAYQANLIDLEDVCTLFAINSHSNGIFTLDQLTDVNAKLTTLRAYTYTRYYGSYYGYCAITLGNTSDMTVVVSEYVANLKFDYPYPGNHIRLIKGDKMFTIKEAYDQKIITFDDVANLFTIHSNSSKVSQELITKLLTPGFDLHKEYIGDFSMNDISLDWYFGEYNQRHIFMFSTKKWLAKYYLDAKDALSIALKYGGSSTIFVLYEGKLYLLDEAVEQKIITKDTKKEVINKRNVFWPQ